MTTDPDDATIAREFVQFAMESGVLRFGEFKTKAGRLSPYFFNSALFDDGAKMLRLAQFYARRLVASGLEFDMLFGPAYKGITLAAATAMALAVTGSARCPSRTTGKKQKITQKAASSSVRRCGAAPSSSMMSSPTVPPSASRSN